LKAKRSKLTANPALKITFARSLVSLTIKIKANQPLNMVICRLLAANMLKSYHARQAPKTKSLEVTQLIIWTKQNCVSRAQPGQLALPVLAALEYP
jgi:hypothetical protein